MIDREAPTLLGAITSAVTQTESVADIHVARVEGEELVSQADIADRSRQAVNHWINRDADSSGFPDPADATATRSPLWRSTDVQPASTPTDRPTISTPGCDMKLSVEGSPCPNSPEAIEKLLVAPKADVDSSRRVPAQADAMTSQHSIDATSPSF